MGGPITIEARNMINEIVEETMRAHPGADALEEFLRGYLKRRWPHVVKAVVTSVSTQP
jgi:hypothetical protein